MLKSQSKRFLIVIKHVEMFSAHRHLDCNFKMFLSARTPAQSDEAKAFSISLHRCSDPLCGIIRSDPGEHLNNMVSVQVQNLTPQLVNAGTIKMTYPENKVPLMAMMAMMTIKTVFEDDVGQRQIMGRKRGLQLATCKECTDIYFYPSL